jgi:hypothetical protein
LEARTSQRSTLPSPPGGEGQCLVAAVAVEQVAQVVGAVLDVDLGVAEVARPEGDAAGPVGDEAGGRGRDLHQPLRARGRPARPELRLRVDDAGDERGVEVLVLGLLADDVLVAQRQGDLPHGLLAQRQEQQRPHPDDDEGAGQERQPAAATHLRAHA